MNGRVYDPVLGRFLSADPFIAYPETTQGFNRYSYVDNNPSDGRAITKVPIRIYQENE